MQSGLGLSGSPAFSLECEDFSFAGPLGSDGAEIIKLGEERFRVKLGHAHEHENWPNMLQFTIKELR